MSIPPPPRLTRQSRVKKKSSIDRIAPEAIEAVITPAVAPAATPSSLPPASVPSNPVPLPSDEDAPEESIYEQMKATMRRQKEEQDAKNAAMKQQRGSGSYGRPGPPGARSGQDFNAPPVAPAPAIVEKVTDFTDLPALWTAARKHLNSTARYLESVLGHSCRIDELHPTTGETFLNVPSNQKGFANEKARAKIEETLRTITGLGIRLALRFTEDDTQAESSRHATAPLHQSVTAQRIAPEVVEAIKAQPLVQQLMKRLDATVVHIEMLDSEEPS